MHTETKLKSSIHNKIRSMVNIDLTSQMSDHSAICSAEHTVCGAKLRVNVWEHTGAPIWDQIGVMHNTIGDRVMLREESLSELPTHAKGDGLGFGFHRVCVISNV